MAVIFLIRESKLCSTIPDFIYFRKLYLWLLFINLNLIIQITHRLLKVTLDALREINNLGFDKRLN